MWGCYEEHNPLPAIEWPEGRPCGSQPRAIVSASGVCLAGAAYPEGNYVEVIWLGSFSASAFAHELMHVHLYNLGDDDPTHSRPEWGYLLSAANQALSNEGL